MTTVSHPVLLSVVGWLYQKCRVERLNVKQDMLAGVDVGVGVGVGVVVVVDVAAAAEVVVVVEVE